MAYRKQAYIFSLVITGIAIVSLVVRGLAVGIDFKGGKEMVVEVAGTVDVNRIKAALVPVLGAEVEVKAYGGSDILVRSVASEGNAQQEEATINTINQVYPSAKAKMVGADVVGPRFAEDMRQAGIYSVVAALIMIFVYILIRFYSYGGWQFGVGAMAATFHDVTITLGLFSLLNGILPIPLQIDQTIIAAFLTIVGYSVNDTVIVFDRVREYMHDLKSESFYNIMNKAMNSTLSRTIITSMTTLFSAVVLFFFGGETIRGFAFAMSVGILFGTYSSVYVASALVLDLKLRKGSK